jgi:hypothetical protein
MLTENAGKTKRMCLCSSLLGKSDRVGLGEIAAYWLSIPTKLRRLNQLRENRGQSVCGLRQGLPEEQDEIYPLSSTSTFCIIRFVGKQRLRKNSLKVVLPLNYKINLKGLVLSLKPLQTLSKTLSGWRLASRYFGFLLCSGLPLSCFPNGTIDATELQIPNKCCGEQDDGYRHHQSHYYLPFHSVSSFLRPGAFLFSTITVACF